MVLLGGAPGTDAHPFGSETLVMVAAGVGHTAAVTDNSRVWVWDLDVERQLGPIPRVEHGPIFAVAPVRWARAACSLSPVVMVACGDEHTLALTRAGRVWSSGFRDMG